MSSKEYTCEAKVAGVESFHVVFLPFLISSHMIPLVHLARLFAARGVRSTIITTVHNALLFQSSVDRDIAAGHPISVRTINFPAAEVGLPVGIENISAARNLEMQLGVLRGIKLLQQPFEKLIRDLAPDCIFSDMMIPWTVDLADELRIPRLMFSPDGFFHNSVLHSLELHEPHKKVKSESESFLVPDLPDEIRMKRSHVSEYLKTKTAFSEVMETVMESEQRSYGLVYNTFYEIEPVYADHIKKIKSPTKLWHIGPLFQFFDDEGRAGGADASEKHSCLSWLDNQNPNSVIYICFGSIPEAQITEIALALEESKQPFIWVVRKEDGEGIGESFEERIKRENKGLIITSWAPQVEVLRHPAVGGFMTHCGWGSILEAIVTGVPMMTWPLFGVQFNNEKLVELLGIGVRVGADVCNPYDEITSPIIKKQNIVDAIKILTSGSGVAESIKRNSKELAMKAKQSVEGGSSRSDLISLIEELKAIKSGPKP